MDLCIEPRYPTPQHAQAARAVVDFFSARTEPQAILLMGSCARGKASPDSCLDIMILVPPELPAFQRNALENAWLSLYARHEAFRAVRAVGAFSQVDLDIIDGVFMARPRGWTGGPDEFELEIGNTLVYSATLWSSGDRLTRLKAQWLPYYDETLRRSRLADVRRFCLNNLDHIPLYVKRELYFQSFNRLYDALREFLQALFITHHTYPIAYDKWIKEQIVDILDLPALYPQLTSLLEIHHFESDEIAQKAELLRNLLETYTQA
jgi:predicted nucleotidyltransferase